MKLRQITPVILVALSLTMSVSLNASALDDLKAEWKQLKADIAAWDARCSREHDGSALYAQCLAEGQRLQARMASVEARIDAAEAASRQHKR